MENERLALITSSLLDSDYMLSHQKQDEILSHLRENYQQEKLDARVAYTLTHKEIIMLILKTQVESLIDPDQPKDDGALKQKLVAARRHKETVQDIERRLAALEDLDGSLDKFSTAIKSLVDSLPPEAAA